MRILVVAVVAVVALVVVSEIRKRSPDLASSSTALMAGEAAPRGGEIVLSTGGGEVRLPVEIMDVYLSENEKAAEHFELHGPGVRLVGTIPPSPQIGYEENWEALVGRTIDIRSRGGADSDAYSTFTLPGAGSLEVTSGQLVVEKIGPAAEYPARRLTGRVTLNVVERGVRRTITGSFSFDAKTWG